ncbi:Glutamyl-tRNA synthetase [Flavobacterium sp. 9AF]|uniref:DUF4175 family protein n=1 Tax=Flavobacterium sp. 9AF TaxID=2653142 RepID=UPI0012F0E982|nr:DUF4175 family protein [Flavobacterium sp. 9AF]VXB37138.1 Glutamyl-tRNA synthetase [Flavobacterium sp. 9AF]
MENKSIIYQKLEAFIKKYYWNELIKGTILFIGFGLLYFIFTFLIEYFLWLSTNGRTFLFWLFILVEVFLLFRFILFPLFKLTKLNNGISYDYASRIIGNHFVEVKDSLLNFLQLSSQNNTSELLLASIEQKANKLQPIPFVNAISYSKNKKFLPYALIPCLLLLIFFISGNSNIITSSFNRVVHYQTHYSPPAPFQFVIENSNFTVEQNRDFTLVVRTIGKVKPENVSIIIGNETYFLEEHGAGKFIYTLKNIVSNTSFYIESNGIATEEFTIKVIDVPAISSFRMILNYPSYVNKSPEIIDGSGNAIVPEGTIINWQINALNTSNIDFIFGTKKNPFLKKDNLYTYRSKVNNSLDYAIVTSNSAFGDYDKLNYSISIIKDQYPQISVQLAPDSLKTEKNLLVGQVSDDYGLYRLDLVYYKKNQPNLLLKKTLSINHSTVDRFLYSFPDGLVIESGFDYEYYFEVYDNDLNNNHKSSKSSVFKHYELTAMEQNESLLKEQNENINSLEKSLQNQDKQMNELDKLQKVNKQKDNLDFKDQKKIEDFINRQKKQDEMMKDFTKKLSENLEEFNPEKVDEKKEELIRRLEETEKQSKENEKLLQELEELSKKLEKDKLFDKADKLKQNSKTQSKNLEQLVELTKRFYVEKKTEQIAQKLNELGDKEEKLAESKDNNLDKQNKLTQQFEDIKKELNELEKENNDLKSPLDIPNDKNEQQDIQNDLNKAEDNLQKNDSKNAGKNQKNAGSKMKQMGKQMAMSMQGSESEQMEEDAKLLRQILDNLLSFSFDEESLLKQSKKVEIKSIQFNKILKEQQDLKNQFKHIDDSLFAVSLRNPKITETILNEVGEIHYNLDKSLELLADNNIYKGTSHQQYILTSANKLADFLSNVRDQMQMQMQSSGSGQPKKGKGQGMQLPDIIQQQGNLGEKMKEGMKSGEKEGNKSGENKNGKEGENAGDKNGKGEKGNKSGSNQNNEAEGDNGTEGNTGKVLEIIKEQQKLRDALQKALEKEGMSGLGQNALQQMKDIEKQLINKGFKNETLNKMLNLKHELLKLENAIQQQGEDNKRKSNTNKNNYTGTEKELSKELKDYLNSIEILNRQSLPLQQNYNQKVQEYFKNND